MTIAEEYNAVNAAEIAVLTKPANDEVLYLVVSVAGCADRTLWFSTLDARNKFYKKLVDAMGVV